MSVPKRNRKESELEFFINAINLRTKITVLLLRDFGIKDKIRDIKYPPKGMSEEDAKQLEELCSKYESAKVMYEFPAWWIDKVRSNLMNILHNLIMNITQANTIYPIHESEFYERRNFQNKAIGNCEQLYQEMQYIISVVPVDLNKYTPFVDMIEREIALLKGWRKSDNRILKNIKETSTNSQKKID